MFTPFVRILLLLLCAALSFVAAYLDIRSLLFITSLVSFILLYGYFRKGTVKLALNHVKKEAYEDAEKVLALTKNPDKLDKKDKAYYLFVKGFIARSKDQYQEAQIFFEESLQEGIRNQTDIAMVLLALTDMEMVKGDKRAAKAYFIQLKDLKVDSKLMDDIRKMQAWIAL
jgi:tetratricopeptide (TPR) repeat protein